MNTFLDNWLLRRAMSGLRGNRPYYNGYVTLGTPSVNAGILTVSDTNSGIACPVAFRPGSSYWSIIMKIRYSSSPICEDIIGTTNMAGSFVKDMLIELSDRDGKTYYTNGNGNWDNLGNNRFIGSINTWFYIRLRFDNGTLYTGSSIDGTTWDENVGTSIVDFDRASYITFGMPYPGSQYFKGEWDLNETKIIINDKLWWSPMAVEAKYIAFRDPAVEAICIANWSSDGIGLTMEDAAAVTSAQLGTTFQGNTQITSFEELQYFTGVTSVSNDAFNSCVNLQRVSFPDGLSGILNRAFTNCPSLNTLHFGSIQGSFTWGVDVWYQTPNVKNVFVPSFNDWLNLNVGTRQITNGFNNGNPIRSSGGHLFIDGSELTSAIIPNSFTTLPARLFMNLENLRTVSFPANVTEIGVSCFENCQNLELDVSGLFQNVQTIHSFVFSGCPKITGVLSLPSLVTMQATYVIRSTGIKSIENLGSIQILNSAVFSMAMLESARLPQTVTEIGYDSFYSTQQIEELEILATVPPTLNRYGFGTFPKKVFVPYSADHSILASYQSATNWSTYASQIYELNPDGTIPS